MIALIPAFFRRTILLFFLFSSFTAQAAIKSINKPYTFHLIHRKIILEAKGGDDESGREGEDGKVEFIKHFNYLSSSIK